MAKSLSHFRAFFQRPELRAGLTSCLVMGSGDFICQAITSSRQSGKEMDGKIKKLLNEWDKKRTARFSLVGLTLHGPFFLRGFQWIDSLLGPSKTLSTAVQKSLVGQVTIFPLYIVLFFTYMGFLEGKTLEQTTKKVQQNFGKTFINGWAFWPPANLFNFMIVPSSKRIFYINGAGLIWNTYLSWQNAKDIPALIDSKKTS